MYTHHGILQEELYRGIILSSGIVKNPTYTMGLLYQVVYRLRTEYNFGGYIHVKAIPGADRSVIEMTGWYADRMSVNLELPTTDGLKSLAPNKSRHNILTPMRQIQNGIKDNVLRLNDNHVAYGNGITLRSMAAPGNHWQSGMLLIMELCVRNMTMRVLFLPDRVHR